MVFRKTPLSGLVVIEPDIYRDDRGFFQEVWHSAKYAPHGIPDSFVQDNRSSSKTGVVRGLHFQNPSPQGKLISVSEGSIFDVAVDIRRDSPTFGRWFSEILTGDNGYQMWVPVGFAHGFMALEDSVVSYKVTDFYDPSGDGAINWKCPRIGIVWPDLPPILSEKDLKALNLDDLDDKRLDF